MDGIDFEVVTDRNFVLRWPEEQLIPMFVTYIIMANGVINVILPAFLSIHFTAFDYINYGTGLLSMVYVIRFMVAAITIEKEYYFKVTSSQSSIRRLIDKP